MHIHPYTHEVHPYLPSCSRPLPNEWASPWRSRTGPRLREVPGRQPFAGSAGGTPRPRCTPAIVRRPRYCLRWGRLGKDEIWGLLGNEWASEWMSEWVSGWVSEWVGGRVYGSVSEWLRACELEWVSEWMVGCVRVGEWMGEWLNEWVDRRVGVNDRGTEWETVGGWVCEWVTNCTFFFSVGPSETWKKKDEKNQAAIEGIKQRRAEIGENERKHQGKWTSRSTVCYLQSILYYVETCKKQS